MRSQQYNIHQSDQDGLTWMGTTCWGRKLRKNPLVEIFGEVLERYPNQDQRVSSSSFLLSLRHHIVDAAFTRLPACGVRVPENESIGMSHCFTGVFTATGDLWYTTLFTFQAWRIVDMENFMTWFVQSGKRLKEDTEWICYRYWFIHCEVFMAHRHSFTLTLALLKVISLFIVVVCFSSSYDRKYKM